MVLVGPNYSTYFDSPQEYVTRFENYAYNAINTDAGISHTEDLLKEIVFVGGSMVPVYWLVDKALASSTRLWNPQTATLFKVALSAGLFHVICEETGVNNWFLTNSVASKKQNKKFWKVNKSAAGTTVDIINVKDLTPATCKGNGCGYSRRSGISHDAYHM
jgi:hypothetical protein